MAGAFPITMRIFKATVKMPVSQVICERSLTKMELIKTYANFMSDDHLQKQ